MTKKQDLLNKLLESQKTGKLKDPSIITKCEMLPEEAFEDKVEKSVGDLKSGSAFHRPDHASHLATSPYKDTHDLVDHEEFSADSASPAYFEGEGAKTRQFMDATDAAKVMKRVAKFTAMHKDKGYDVHVTRSNENVHISAWKPKKKK